MKRKKVELYDTTLRDGAQQAGISFSRHNKLVIMHKLDRLGVQYVELGYMEKDKRDSKLFGALKRNPLKTAKIVAFGMTCRAGNKAEEDKGLALLLSAETEIITIYGKSSRWHAKNDLGVTPEENLRLIKKSCKFLTEQGRIVFFDAEHFFDGYKEDRAYALDCLKAAATGGASRIIPCDTNGGSLPWEIASAITDIRKNLAIPLGIHAHNDAELAVANSLAAVKAGADQVQGTINGYGERCGNANLCSIVPALKKKMGIECISDQAMSQLMEYAHSVAEVANLQLNPHQPYAGKLAFCHKAGTHASAILKNPGSYNHIDPKLVGNASSVVVSKVSGRSNIAIKAKEFGISLSPEQENRVLAKVKGLARKGFQFDDADGSLKLIMMRQVSGRRRPFEILKREVSSRKVGGENPVDSAIVKLRINKIIAHEVADGDGPINALDKALRKALVPHFPVLEKVKLVDYKVRVPSGKRGTAEKVKLSVDFSDGKEEWTMAGCSTDLIEASKQALLDGFEYAIVKAL